VGVDSLEFILLKKHVFSVLQFLNVKVFISTIFKIEFCLTNTFRTFSFITEREEGLRTVNDFLLFFLV
jgi:hypothetical protein